jgi:SAM-dependent methyltransferase
MFSQSHDLYDVIYGRMKDYAAEAAALAARIRRECPDARTVLDVACGTGEHARQLAALGFAVDGIDLDPEFVRLARAKHPAGRFECADMRDFDLGRTYDAVLCMFSSIGYAKTLDGVAAALARFRAHLAPGGLVIVEPWFTPDAFIPGHVHVLTAEGPGVHVARMSHGSVDDRLSRIHFEYLIGRADGITHVAEDHEAGLFTVDETLACFRAAGLACEHEVGGPMGRGLYVARAA